MNAARNKPQGSINQTGLEKSPANFAALSPLDFLARAAGTYPGKTAIIHGEAHTSYAEFYARCRRLASVLSARGIGLGDTVSVIAHFKCPKTVIFCELPKTSTVKVQKFTLREQAEALDTSGRNL